MHILGSDRLGLIALTIDQIRQIQLDPPTLYSSLGLIAEPLLVNPPEFMIEFDEAISDFTIPNLLQYPDRYLWYTHWLIILSAERRVVGGIGLAGWPDERGETMVGYFVDSRYEGWGIAGEALSLLLDWLKDSAELRALLALTPTDHVASQKVLQRNGFLFDGQAEPGVVRWRRTLW